ncbi:exocyst complex subunit 6 [Tieghemostelium lacteum]|uniref:Exocyst complex subunit 6 n=1 Tax=Tieghemostelium lacteum TaxID=361077 RepID=A0A152A3P9_TIELA|nr:exocyst complex subunit 6 [Tieghemostelium lacteum]|eukprot:KYR00727.1 exocyst complex subunit 6 [Tieghemostelium lacteum]
MSTSKITSSTPVKGSTATPSTPQKEKNIIPTKKDKKDEKKERREKEKLDKLEAKEKKKKEKLDKKEAKKTHKKTKSVSFKPGSPEQEGDKDTESQDEDENDLLTSTGSNNIANTGDKSTGTDGRSPGMEGIYSSDIQDEQEPDEEQLKLRENEMFSSESFLIAVSDTDHLGPAIKSVFENNKDKEVIKSLNAYINQKDQDIEKICGDNHEDFINSVQEFLGLKEQNLDLKQLVINLNYDLQEIGTHYTNKADELFAYKVIKDNIKKTKEILNNCQYVILLAMKIDEYVKNKNYFQAIRNMDQLHNVYLKRLGDFQFARNMDYNIPIMKERIKKAVKEDFNTWMVDIKERSFIIGKLGMVQTAKKLEKEREINPLKIKTTFGENEVMWDKILDIQDSNRSVIGSLSIESSSGIPQAPSSPTSHHHNKNLDALLQQAEERLKKEEFIQNSPFDECSIDFHPLYQCLFIYSSLGLIEEFQSYYTFNRLLQFQLVIQPREIHQDWEVFLQQIAGYFMVESKVMASTDPLLSKSTISDSWNSALVKVTSVLQELFTHCHDTRSLSGFKKFVLIFTETLAYYGYHVQPLYYLLDTMKEKYSQFSIKEAADKFSQILEKESFVNLTVESKEEYETLIAANHLDPTESPLLNSTGATPVPQNSASEAELLEQRLKELPKTYLFSKMVPQFYTLIKKFISEFYEFSDQLTENEDVVIRSTDTLIKKVNEIIYNYLSQSQAVPQIIQIVINLQHLIYACSFFKNYLNSLILGTDSSGGASTGSNSGLKESATKIQLSSQNLLFATKNHGEKLIIKSCEGKIEDLMSSSANINWTPQASEDRPRDYIVDVCVFLDFNLPFIQPLSQNLREEFISKSFKKIAELLSNLLYSEHLKRINLAGIKCFDADLKYMEDFVRQKESAGLSSRNLSSNFSDLRQLVNLLKSDKPEEFGEPSIRNKKYNLITNYQQLYHLLGKFKEEAKLFSSSKEKERNNSVAEAMKKIKSLF